MGSRKGLEKLSPRAERGREGERRRVVGGLEGGKTSRGGLRRLQGIWSTLENRFAGFKSVKTN